MIISVGYTAKLAPIRYSNGPITRDRVPEFRRLVDAHKRMKAQAQAAKRNKISASEVMDFANQIRAKHAQMLDVFA